MVLPLIVAGVGLATAAGAGIAGAADANRKRQNRKATARQDWEEGYMPHYEQTYDQLQPMLRDMAVQNQLTMARSGGSQANQAAMQRAAIAQSPQTAQQAELGAMQGAHQIASGRQTQQLQQRAQQHAEDTGDQAQIWGTIGRTGAGMAQGMEGLIASDERTKAFNRKVGHTIPAGADVVRSDENSKQIISDLEQQLAAAQQRNAALEGAAPPQGPAAPPQTGDVAYADAEQGYPAPAAQPAPAAAPAQPGAPTTQPSDAPGAVGSMARGAATMAGIPAHEGAPLSGTEAVGGVPAAEGREGPYGQRDYAPGVDHAAFTGNRGILPYMEARRAQRKWEQDRKAAVGAAYGEARDAAYAGTMEERAAAGERGRRAGEAASRAAEAAAASGRRRETEDALAAAGATMEERELDRLRDLDTRYRDYESFESGLTAGAQPPRPTGPARRPKQDWEDRPEVKLASDTGRGAAAGAAGTAAGAVGGPAAAATAAQAADPAAAPPPAADPAPAPPPERTVEAAPVRISGRAPEEPRVTPVDETVQAERPEIREVDTRIFPSGGRSPLERGWDWLREYSSPEAHAARQRERREKIGPPPRSDERSKEAVSMLEETPGYMYTYKDEYAGSPGTAPGPQYGIMAQDLEKTPMGDSMVIDNAFGDGMKGVDTDRLTMANSAAMNDILKRLSALEGKGGRRG